MNPGFHRLPVDISLPPVHCLSAENGVPEYPAVKINEQNVHLSFTFWLAQLNYDNRKLKFIKTIIHIVERDLYR